MDSQQQCLRPAVGSGTKVLRQPLLALLPLLLLLQPLEERDSRVSEAPPMPIHFNPSGLNGFSSSANAFHPHLTPKGFPSDWPTETCWADCLKSLCLRNRLKKKKVAPGHRYVWPLQVSKEYSPPPSTVTSTALKKQKHHDLSFKGKYKSKLRVLGLAHPVSLTSLRPAGLQRRLLLGAGAERCAPPSPESSGRKGTSKIK